MRSVRKKRAQDKMYYRLRQESIKAANRARYWANPEKYRERSREYSRINYRANPEKYRERSREYSRICYRANPEKYRERSREYSRICYRANPEKYRERSREYSRINYWKKKASSGKTPNIQKSQCPSHSDITTWPVTPDPGTTQHPTSGSSDTTTWAAATEPGSTAARPPTSRPSDTPTDTKPSNSDHRYPKHNNSVSVYYFCL